MNKLKDRLPKLTRKDYEKRLDLLVSVITRYSNAQLIRGVHYNTCITSGRFLPVSELDCGHFVGRANRHLRWDLRNTHPQSKRDNRFLDGNLHRYTLKMIELYGQETVEDMLRLDDEWKTGQLKPLSMPQLKTLYDQIIEIAIEVETKQNINKIPKKWIKEHYASITTETPNR